MDSCHLAPCVVAYLLAVTSRAGTVSALTNLLPGKCPCGHLMMSSIKPYRIRPCSIQTVTYLCRMWFECMYMDCGSAYDLRYGQQDPAGSVSEEEGVVQS
jgi:hypothetical protein